MRLSTNPCNVYIEKDTLIDCGITVNKRIKTILLTHCHFDHVLQVKEVKEKNNAKVVMQRDDAEAIEKRMLHRVFYPVEWFEIDLKFGERVEIGDFTAIHTPGHTVGSCSYYSKLTGNFYTGDVIFEGYCFGRTDMPTGSFETLKKSIDKIYKFCGENGVKRICPGHGNVIEGDIRGYLKELRSRMF